MPIAAKTAVASLGGATWRIFLTPIDTFKTTLQVQGPAAMQVLQKRVAEKGIGQLYAGCVANFTANWVGNCARAPRRPPAARRARPGCRPLRRRGAGLRRTAADWG